MRAAPAAPCLAAGGPAPPARSRFKYQRRPRLRMRRPFTQRRVRIFHRDRQREPLEPGLQHRLVIKPCGSREKASLATVAKAGFVLMLSLALLLRGQERGTGTMRGRKRIPAAPAAKKMPRIGETRHRIISDPETVRRGRPE